ncbi:MAG: UDP-N-acetylmuramoyl-L-alanyl-D-glutamate--2,6-diaminopimelate ligase [Oscillospiraceae bacterium]|nr:UDP-N-acetylmuramoyl-L-alanyl-D-glutamate--2,6-diaminopimelate ligase [Oscillospiraceae bacterium]
MLLSEILTGLDFKGGFEEREIANVCSDSRRVVKNSVFVCIKGRSFDGHEAADEAIKKGAAAVVTERKLGLENELLVSDTRQAYAKLSQNYFGNPQRGLKLIAVTGTNGKTTVTNTIKQALCSLGIKTGLIGTIHCEIDELTIPAKFTTPEAWDLAALFSRMLAASCTHVVLEASSQALEQGRLLGLRFDCAVFTNLTQDHLDYHGDMESYYRAKKLLFQNAKRAVINTDDEYGKRLAKEIKIPVTSVSAKEDSASYTAKFIECSITAVRFELCGDGYLHRIHYAMPGLYSVHNALCSAAVLFALGIDRSEACDAVSKTKSVRGRCEVLYSGDFTVICDFAHTADGLEQLLSSIRPFVKGRLVTLFGCAGDRDPKKRPPMAKAAAKYSDFIVLSSDNPRSEDPLGIIAEVSEYLKETGVPFTAIADRYLAIKWALENSQKDDVLALCGKGHEDYQVIDGCTIYLDEHRIVSDFFSKRS